MGPQLVPFSRHLAAYSENKNITPLSRDLFTSSDIEKLSNCNVSTVE